MSEFSFKRTFGPCPKYENVINYKRNNDEFIYICGPCSIESIEHAYKMAKTVRESGATHFRGGVFRAGTYPNSNKFGYIDNEIIRNFHIASKENGLKNIIEVLDYSKDQMDLISNYCDAFQVGARSMQNYTLLRKLGEYKKPVFIKRSAGSNIDEFLGAAEHLLISGVKDLFLIERGGSSIHNHVRWDLSISIIPAIKSITQIPIIVDASHGTGRRDLVTPMTLAGVAAGANGVLIEVHENPEMSLSDPDQAININEFKNLMNKINKVKEAIK